MEERPDIFERLIFEANQMLPMPIKRFFYAASQTLEHDGDSIELWNVLRNLSNLWRAFIDSGFGNWVAVKIHPWMCELRELILDQMTISRAPLSFLFGWWTGTLLVHPDKVNFAFLKQTHAFKSSLAPDYQMDEDLSSEGRERNGKILWHSFAGFVAPALCLYFVPKVASKVENTNCTWSPVWGVISLAVCSWSCVQGLFSSWRCREKVIGAHKRTTDLANAIRSNRTVVERILAQLPFHVKYSSVETGSSFLPQLVKAILVWQHTYKLRTVSSPFVGGGLLLSTVVFANMK